MYGRVIYVASPLKGDIEGNLKKATAYCSFVAKKGATPIAPHLFFASFLDDNKKEERLRGMAMGIDLLKRCDELWVFGEPSQGMRREIEIAQEEGIPVDHISEKTIKEILKGGQEHE